MKIKNILALLLALCMVFALVACGGETETTDKDEPKQTEGTEATTEATTDGKVTYTVKVVDEKGNPYAGAMVQLCLDACVPAVTDANGIATWNLEKADYKVSFVTMPEGYTAEKENFYFDTDSYEMTITIKSPAAQAKEYVVKFVDEGNNPVNGATVQLVKESGETKSLTAYENGKVSLTTKDFVLKAVIETLPAGYTADATEYLFEGTNYEITIVLKAVA
jgi:hypothetical protein